MGCCLRTCEFEPFLPKAVVVHTEYINRYPMGAMMVGRRLGFLSYERSVGVRRVMSHTGCVYGSEGLRTSVMMPC